MFHKFHRKTPVLESLFDKAAGLKTRKFIKKRNIYFEEYLRTTASKYCGNMERFLG